MGLQPSPSQGDAPWQPITPAGLEEEEMPWEGPSPCSHTGQQAPKPPTMVRRRGQPPPNLLFPVDSSQLSTLGPSMPSWGSGWQGTVVKAGASLLLAVL